jgi:hypothetical protein
MLICVIKNCYCHIKRMHDHTGVVGKVSILIFYLLRSLFSVKIACQHIPSCCKWDIIEFTMKKPHSVQLLLSFAYEL